MAVSRSVPRAVLPSGIPCWVELATLDEEATRRFYSRLFGWTFHLNPDPATPDGRYLVATLGRLPVGGLYRTPAGRPSHWTINISVASTASAAQWVAHLGGAVTLGPVDIPGRGSIVHAEDPTGAPLVLWRPPADWNFGIGLPCTFATADLNTHDGPAADAFFCRLFRYTALQIGDTRGVDYTEWRLEQEPVLYRYVMGPEYPRNTPAHWMVYFAVDPALGINATAGHAVMLGGRAVVEPYDSPWGRIAVLADPSGAVFSIVDRTRVSPEWGRAEVDDPYDD
jgi:predicted enzyme related to lactoylglutathione lyase